MSVLCVVFEKACFVSVGELGLKWLSELEDTVQLVLLS